MAGLAKQRNVAMPAIARGPVGTAVLTWFRNDVAEVEDSRAGGRAFGLLRQYQPSTGVGLEHLRKRDTDYCDGQGCDAHGDEEVAPGKQPADTGQQRDTATTAE